MMTFQFAAVLLICGAPDANYELASARPADIWRTANRCGINSLYTALRLRNVDVTYAEVSARLPVSEQGTSLTEMRRCSESFGLPCKIMEGSPESLLHCEYPVIAYCEEAQGTGHYVVVIQSRDDGVLAVDGTTATISWWSMDDFRDRWSGYLLVFGKAQQHHGVFVLAVVLSGTFLFMALLWRTPASGKAGPASGGKE